MVSTDYGSVKLLPNWGSALRLGAFGIWEKFLQSCPECWRCGVAVELYFSVIIYEDDGGDRLYAQSR